MTRKAFAREVLLGKVILVFESTPHDWIFTSIPEFFWNFIEISRQACKIMGNLACNPISYTNSIFVIKLNSKICDNKTQSRITSKTKFNQIENWLHRQQALWSQNSFVVFIVGWLGSRQAHSGFGIAVQTSITPMPACLCYSRLDITI